MNDAKRVYYPLYPRKPKKYKIPPTFYLSVDLAENPGQEFYIGVLLDDNLNPVIKAKTAGELSQALSQLPNKSWVITFGLNGIIKPMFYGLIDHFESLSGYENQTTILYCEREGQTVYIIDLFPFFGSSFVQAISGAGLDWASISRDAKLIKTAEQFNIDRAGLIGQLWHSYRDHLRDLFGVTPSKSPGATSLKSYRAVMPVPIKAKGKPIRKLSQLAISGGALHWEPGYYNRVWSYDINASYPGVMREIGFPLRVTAFIDREPKTDRFIAMVNIDYKTELKFSPLAVKAEGGLTYHPVIAKNLTVVLTYLDILILQALGDLKINQFIEGIFWDKEYPLFDSWVNMIENYITENPGAKSFLKTTSRALHSKFSQVPGVPIAEYRQIKRGELKSRMHDIFEIIPLDDGRLIGKFLEIKEPGFQSYLFPHYEALILSGGRYNLYRFVDENTVYTDTDNIISTVERPDLEIGPEIGKWKVQAVGECYILGPRSYTIGKQAKQSGAKIADRKKLYNGIVKAFYEGSSELETDRGAGLPSVMPEQPTFKLSKIDYPKTVTDGEYIYFVGSDRKERVKKPGRVIH
jgi:hypothetical protein